MTNRVTQSRTAVRLSDSEHDALAALCEYHQLTLSAMLRQLILAETRRIERRRQGDQSGMVSANE